MPAFRAKTVNAQQVWASPDGQRVIYSVTLDTGQGQATAKTYSKAIAQVGFEGDVETYEKTGQQGSETFVKQPPKEGGSYGGGSGGGSTGRGAGKPMADPYTMYMSYAKDILVAFIAAGNDKGMKYEDALQYVIGGAHELYDSRPDAPPKPEAGTDTVIDSADTTDLLKDLDKIFPGSTDASNISG